MYKLIHLYNIIYITLGQLHMYIYIILYNNMSNTMNDKGYVKFYIL